MTLSLDMGYTSPKGIHVKSLGDENNNTIVLIGVETFTLQYVIDCIEKFLITRFPGESATQKNILGFLFALDIGPGFSLSKDTKVKSLHSNWEVFPSYYEWRSLGQGRYDTITIAKNKISFYDFYCMVEYVFCNTNLTLNDPRLVFLKKVKQNTFYIN